MKLPKRMFRDRRLPDPVNDRRTVEYTGPPTVPAPQPDLGSAIDLSKHIVVVPVHRFIDTDTYHCLRGLEDLGLRVDYSKGCSAIDVTRSLLASEALEAGAESILFIDSDMLFDPADAVSLILRPEPIVAGVYAAKKLGNGQINVHFPEGTGKIKLGSWADQLYRVNSVGAGFLRIRMSVFRLMIERLKLPRCRIAHSYGWPFFQPVIVEEEGETRYLAEDYAFCWRCRQVGVPILADTSFRLYHIGEYAYGWEEAGGQYIVRERDLECDLRTVPACRPTSRLP